MISAPSDLHSLPEFLSALELEGASAKTLKSYGSDLKQFAQWFESTLGETFSPASITPTDIRDYRSFLINVEQRQPATVNRHLASLRKFCLWAQDQGLLQEVPTRQIKGVASSPRSPRSLEKREVDRLIRAAEKAGDKRDLAIIST